MLKLGETDFDNGHTQRDYNPISVRPRSLSVRLICLGLLAVAKTSKLGGAGYEESVGPSLTFGLGHMCGSGKVVEGIWSISLST